jgi:hypothetical protein
MPPHSGYPKSFKVTSCSTGALIHSGGQGRRGKMVPLYAEHRLRLGNAGCVVSMGIREDECLERYFDSNSMIIIMFF